MIGQSWKDASSLRHEVHVLESAYITWCKSVCVQMLYEKNWNMAHGLLNRPCIDGGQEMSYGGSNYLSIESLAT